MPYAVKYFTKDPTCKKCNSKKDDDLKKDEKPPCGILTLEAQLEEYDTFGKGPDFFGKCFISDWFINFFVLPSHIGENVFQHLQMIILKC